MAFAIFYELSDITSIVANAGPLSPILNSLTNAQKQIAQRAWNGGLNGWQTAPSGQSPSDPPGSCPLCKRVVVDASPAVTLQQFRDVLYAIAASLGGGPDVQYIKALADDMGGVSGAVEPWPPP